MFDYMIVTHLPAFYKVNLYNELAKKLNIFVVFVANETIDKRSSDFASLTSACFEYTVLSNQAFQDRNKFVTLWKLVSVIYKTKYNKLLVNGWELPEFWLSVLISANRKNCLALESTVIESNTQGITGIIKKLFLGMVNTVFASGDLHVELLKKLNYKKNIKVTLGVGIINKPDFEFKNRPYERKFLFIGRLSKEKNLAKIIGVFNDLPGYKLTIIGSGEEKAYLKSIANHNTIFLDPIENKKLKDEFQKNNIFILPSVSEPWGLVVEEAIYFGLPVIVSKFCGASQLIENDETGFIIDPHDTDDMHKTIRKIDSVVYNRLVENILIKNLDDKDETQASSYEVPLKFN